MMEAVKKGGNRQEIHEIIRICSMEATAKMKAGEECYLLDRLAENSQFGLTREEMEKLLEPEKYTGRCAEQVERYVEKIKPYIECVSEASAEINL